MTLARGFGMLGSHSVSLVDILLFQIYSSNVSSTVWGQPTLRLPPTYAAFVNGVAVRRFPCLFHKYNNFQSQEISQKLPNFHILLMASLKFLEMKWTALPPFYVVIPVFIVN